MMKPTQPVLHPQDPSLVDAAGEITHQMTITGKSHFIHMHSVYSKYILSVYTLNNTSKTMKSQRFQKQMPPTVLVIRLIGHASSAWVNGSV